MRGRPGFRAAAVLAALVAWTAVAAAVTVAAAPRAGAAQAGTAQAGTARAGAARAAPAGRSRGTLPPAGVGGGKRGGLSFLRVDVSRYPRIGLVVTVPGGPCCLARRLRAGDFSVTAGGRPVASQVRQLSPADVELAVAPAGGLAPAAFAAQRAAAIRFVTGLPAGERTVAVSPGAPGVLPGTLSADPAPAVLAVAGMTARPRGAAAARLVAALSAFTAGPRVRRTVVLVVAADQPPPRARLGLFARWLAASGTALYVLDAAPGGAPGYDALAAGSGGFAARVTGAGGWDAAFARIGDSLAGQYYLRFTDRLPVPGLARVTVRTPSGVLSGVARLPARNPDAPPLPPAPPPARPPRGGTRDAPLVLLATTLIVVGISYGLSMLTASRWNPRRRGQAGGEPGRGAAPAGDLLFVFLMPCLNEEAVIANSLRRLLAVTGGEFVVLVIDDGSDDRTAEVVQGIGDDRVWLLRRRPPQARQGKGEALNAALRYLAGNGYLEGRDPDRVIAVVVDADGRLDPDSLRQVAPVFADPRVGAVQIGVRINNRFRSTLARMQDMEFVIYTEVFQRGRRHVGSVGLGGNGQFMRLSAIRSLGQAPWSSALAEDLDLGIRLIAAGWRNEYCSDAAVHQQGVEELRRLIRQRSRWFQGHLQSWRLIPVVLRRVSGPARADLLYHMTSPAVLLIASLLSASFVVSLGNAVLAAARGRDPVGWWLASTYLLTFGPAMAFSAVYWSKERASGLGVARAVALAHVYVCYGMMWYAAGWWAVGRTLRGRTSWSKTDRVAEVPSAAPGRHRHRRGRRRPVAVAAALAVVAAGAVAAGAGLRGGARTPAWVTAFNGYGSTSVTGSGPSLAVSLAPARASTRASSHAALVLTARSYRNFAATLRLRTVEQLRGGAAGRPNAWEVAWVVWHYTSDHRFYALTLEPTGWELSKQDPAYPGGERFLASGLAPVFPPGRPYTVGIVQLGDRITVSAGGQVLARFTDTEHPYLGGAAGLYTEDARATFDHITISQLTISQHTISQHPISQHTTGGN